MHVRARRRRSSLVGRALVLVLSALAPASTSAAQGIAGKSTEPARPNVLILLADDLGYADIGVQGCREIPTPNIDSIAREGVRCTSAYVTSPRCAPSRAALLTGRYQERLGCELDAERGLPEGEATVAERVRAAGYATGLIGKWHLGRADKDHPCAHGFGEFYGFVGGLNAYLPKSPDPFVPKILRGREPAEEKSYLTDAFGREAAAFLERHASEPFYLVLSFNAPHGPLQATPELLARFDALTPPVRRAYAAAVSSMDDAIGVVLAKLHALGLDEKTLVFFLSDNGGPLSKRGWNGSSNAPLRGQKGTVWEGGIRVPFLARWKGVVPAGRICDVPISTLDLAPTTFALAGIAPQPEWGLDGTDILPLLEGKESDPPHGALFWRFSFPPRFPEQFKWAIRMGDLKLVHCPERDENTGEVKGVDVTALYDVARDPGETKDLAAERPEDLKRLEARYREWNAGLPPGPRLPSSGAVEQADPDDERDD